MAASFWERFLRFAPAKRTNQRGGKKRQHLRLEHLEAREVPAGFAQPNYVLLPNGNAAHPLSSAGPTGYSPSQIAHAYGFDSISFSNGTVTGDGTGTTIAIVDAYDDPNIANDLHQFDQKFGISDPPSFKKVNQSGGTTMPSANAGWASEIALDVEWAHAMAPGANILLVEASSNSFGNLLTAVHYAASQSGVVAVSMSWDGGEFSGETSYDSYFTTPTGHAGVTFLAASGDSGAPAEYPAASPNVLSVGGTTLKLDSSNNISSETAWDGSGGGLSSYESQPSYQSSVVTQSTTKRGTPDVAYDADPNTGFPVNDSYNNGTSAPWSQFGGTSDAAPQWAALIAIADQGRALNSLGALDGAKDTLPKLYSMSASDFNDITSGSSQGSPTLSAGNGYDLVTGRGTPIANLVVADLVGTAVTPSATHFSVSAPSSAVAGSPFSVTVTALDASGNTFTSYTGTIHFSSADTAAGLPADYQFTSTDQGSHTFTVTLKTAGNEKITATDTVVGALTGNATVAVSASTASQLAFGQQPGNTTVGSTISPAVTVRVLDAYGNLVTSDNSDQVTLTLNNAGTATLGGSATATVSSGVATFNNLTVSAAGTGYSLSAAATGLSGATSSSFNVSAAGSSSSGSVIEGFESTSYWHVVGGFSLTAARATYAAHDGTYGLDDYNGNDWIYRTDSAVQNKAGDTISVWLKFAGSANGRAYFGFGSSSSGTYSLVAAPNTGQLILQLNSNYGFTDLASVSQSYSANHWYRLEVDWGSGGTIVGKLFDSNGTTQLNSVSTTSSTFTSGGIAFRATGNDKYWDTVTLAQGVNTSVRAAVAAPSSSSSGAPAWLQALWAWETQHGLAPTTNLWAIWSQLPASVRSAIVQYFAGLQSGDW